MNSQFQIPFALTQTNYYVGICVGHRRLREWQWREYSLSCARRQILVYTISYPCTFLTERLQEHTYRTQELHIGTREDGFCYRNLIVIFQVDDFRSQNTCWITALCAKSIATLLFARATGMLTLVFLCNFLRDRISACFHRTLPFTTLSTSCSAAPLIVQVETRPLWVVN